MQQERSHAMKLLEQLATSSSSLQRETLQALEFCGRNVDNQTHGQEEKQLVFQPTTIAYRDLGDKNSLWKTGSIGLTRRNATPNKSFAN
jgi:hypothetical protein